MEDILTLKELIEERAAVIQSIGKELEEIDYQDIEYILSVGAGIGAQWALSKVALDVPNIEEMVRDAMEEVFRFEISKKEEYEK